MNVKILLVDDEKDITDLLSKYLSLEGYNVTAVNCPKEALKMVEEDNFHILITDIMMNEMTGVELTEKVKKYNGLIQVIAITGYVTMDNILSAFRYGVNNCFFKPFENLEVIKEEVDVAIKKLNRITEVLKGLKKMG